MEYKFLKYINSPDDVKNIQPDDIDALCEEIRDCILNTVSQNGGHLASNLGAVELTVALHRVFNSPKDSIIFDVGHQCYTHKLLTGRFSKFDTLRKENGISGFMRPNESEHDPFVTGHSSNSISAALGIAKANALKGDNSYAVAVIGDGALTGGMIYEAMNNSSRANKNLIIVINDNKMSISKNVGSLSKHLNAIRSSAKYHKAKRSTESFLDKLSFVGVLLKKIILFFKNLVKSFVVKNNLFEDLGFEYLGPVDGHNEKKVEELLRIAKTTKSPAIIHVVTQKGKGYKFAETKPQNYHGVGPFNKSKGVSVAKECFSSIFGETLCELAKSDSSVCAITAAMTDGTGLCEFSKAFKNRFFDVGIAEQHAVTFSAGLASKGMKPYFAVYSSFLQRGYDQVIHDAAVANLPVTLCIDRAGLVGEDGETHQGLFDVSFLSAVPNIEMYSPATYAELKKYLKYSLNPHGLLAIRYPRGAEICDIDAEYDPLDAFSVFGDATENVIITYGRITVNALQAAKILCKNGINTSVVKINRLAPLSTDLISKLKEYKHIFFFEEGIKKGGIGEQTAALLMVENNKNTISFKINAVDGEFARAADIYTSINEYGLSCDAMIKTVSGGKDVG